MNDSNSKTGVTAAIACGFHAVEAALAQGTVAEVVVDERRRDRRAAKLRQAAARAGVTVRRIERAALDDLSGGVKHQGVAAKLRPATPGRAKNPGHAKRDGDRETTETAGKTGKTGKTAAAESGQPGQTELCRLLDRLQHPPLLLILDRIQDPHNLGACLRAADGAGADAVVLPKHGACKVTPAAARVAAGAAARMPVFRVTNLARALDELRARGIWLTGADAAAEGAFYAVDWRAPAGLILGAEGRGLRRLTRQRCDQLARIPLAADGVASLNVAVAAGVFLFEARRQRQG